MRPALNLSLLATLSCSTLFAAEAKPVKLTADSITNEAGFGTPQALVDEQEGLTTLPPTAVPATGWAVPSNKWKEVSEVSAYIDLGEKKAVASLWVYDLNGTGDLVISAGEPSNWQVVRTHDCKAYKKWVEVELSAETRYIRLTRKDGGSNINEVVVTAYDAKDWPAAKAAKQAEAKAKAEAEAAAAKLKADREAGQARAIEEAKNRPTVDLGDPFGKVLLVDEINVAAADPAHLFTQDPSDASEVQTILGKPCRVLKKTPGEGAYIAVRVGQYKLLKPGAAYILEVEYPEDAPRSTMILNSGCESSNGFATGEALGDAFRPKYVNNLNESVKYPLSGKFKTWTQLFNLHDRFSNVQYVRGETGNRDLLPVDGFTVTICQFSAESLPISAGAAISRIRLFEVPDTSKLQAKYTLPPEGLPRRHISWREEMADMVLHGEKSGTKPGVEKPVDWYRFKAEQMAFLGINTFTKDLLEFGAVQGWNSTPHGGNKWAYFSGEFANVWSDVVKLMGERSYTILPYYEYAGSKGQQGLGNQRRAKPLTRDDAFTHIKWIENANADITDPDTYEDFKKMLDLTIVREKDKAKFIGAWLRPRSQLPMGFGDTTRKRFADEANDGREVTRQQLREDKALYGRYVKWWMGKRQQFFVAMRDYLRQNGIDDATILYTAYAGEPGVGFKGPAVMVVDDVERWQTVFQASKDEREQKTRPITIKEVVEGKMYLTALQTPPANWGGWELQHANPIPDPENYKNVDGVLMTHAFNRLYTVSSPETFDLFRGPSGLALERHYSLNENMMFDKNDKAKLGYFAADIERNGPHCMAGEAMAMANGDPRYITYLVGRTYMRGFPQYVRSFNTAFLSLPALPSQRLNGASSDSQVVVRSIPTEKHGIYLAVVNAGMTDKTNVHVTLPKNGKVTDAASGEVLPASGGKLQLTMHPWQLRALRIEP